jgi:hypothetical protein
MCNISERRPIVAQTLGLNNWCQEGDLSVACTFTVGILASLRNYEDIWEHICCFVTGDALNCLASVRFFKKPTLQTPAFMCLSGLNNDAELVPWADPDNFLSVHYTWRPLSNYRNTCAIIAADEVFSQLRYPIYSRNFQMGGPARPSSPVPHHCDLILRGPAPSGHRCIQKVYGAPIYSLPNPNYNDYIRRYLHLFWSMRARDTSSHTYTGTSISPPCLVSGRVSVSHRFGTWWSDLTAVILMKNSELQPIKTRLTKC